MYRDSYPLPEFSNREDFLLTMLVADDDTGLPISLTGTQLVGAGAAGVVGGPPLGPGGVAFTGALWSVVDGAIVTNSATQITIPSFPGTGKLLALPLAVGLGLAILPGDAITIFDTPTGLNTMSGYVTSYNAATGALVVQIGWAPVFEIRSGRPQVDGSGYIGWWDYGTPDTQAPLMRATLAGVTGLTSPSLQPGGISIVDIGYVQIFIPRATFGVLAPRTYNVGMNMTDGINTRQLFRGTLPVSYGGVT